MSPANTISIIGGQGFIGRSVAKTFLQKNNSKLIKISRNPPSLVGGSSSTVSAAVAADVTDKSSLLAACQGSSTIINLVGIMYESPPKYTFESVQAKGAANVAEVAKSIGANLVHVSAIGADSSSTIPYARTKGLGEEAVLDTYKERSVILRPSLVFGKDDDFFNRFARLANFLPFLPLFGGGHSKFQPGI